MLTALAKESMAFCSAQILHKFIENCLVGLLRNNSKNKLKTNMWTDTNEVIYLFFKYWSMKVLITSKCKSTVLEVDER